MREYDKPQRPVHFVTGAMLGTTVLARTFSFTPEDAAEARRRFTQAWPHATVVSAAGGHVRCQGGQS